MKTAIVAFAAVAALLVTSGDAAARHRRHSTERAAPSECFRSSGDVYARYDRKLVWASYTTKNDRRCWFAAERSDHRTPYTSPARVEAKEVPAPAPVMSYAPHAARAEAPLADMKLTPRRVRTRSVRLAEFDDASTQGDVITPAPRQLTLSTEDWMLIYAQFSHQRVNVNVREWPTTTTATIVYTEAADDQGGLSFNERFSTADRMIARARRLGLYDPARVLVSYAGH